MEDLPAPELEAMGNGFFQAEHEKAINKSVLDGTGVVKDAQYSMNNDESSK